jgi:DNA polymerase-3 subunit chi
MTRIDFYILENSDASEVDGFACRLVEKAFRSGMRVHVQTPSVQAAQRLDTLLWTFRAGSFVPHRMQAADIPDEPIATPVTIGHADLAAPPADVLVNLSTATAANFAGFTRVAEVVTADPASRQAARERYRWYREQGCELHNHTIHS